MRCSDCSGPVKVIDILARGYCLLLECECGCIENIGIDELDYINLFPKKDYNIDQLLIPGLEEIL